MLSLPTETLIRNVQLSEAVEFCQYLVDYDVKMGIPVSKLRELIHFCTLRTLSLQWEAM